MTSSLGQVIARVSAALEQANVTYMIVGSIASGIHGIPRAVQDLDVVIDCDKYVLRDFVAALDDARYHVDREAARAAWAARSSFHVIDIETAWRVDLRVRRIRPFSREELARRQPIVLAEARAYVATAEDTILATLEWARDRGRAERLRRDCADIVGVQGDALDRAYIATWAAELGVLDEWAIVADG